MPKIIQLLRVLHGASEISMDMHDILPGNRSHGDRYLRGLRCYPSSNVTYHPTEFALLRGDPITVYTFSIAPLNTGHDKRQERSRILSTGQWSASIDWREY